MYLTIITTNTLFLVLSVSYTVGGNCTFGDDPLFQYNNLKCEILNTTTQHYCYIAKVKKSCCETCRNFSLPLINDVDSSFNLTLTFDEQCTLMNKFKSTFCANSLNANRSTICTSIPCTVAGNCEHFLATAGTNCGNDKVCLGGECTFKSKFNEDETHLSYTITALVIIALAMTATVVIYIFKRTNERYKDIKRTKKTSHKVQPSVKGSNEKKENEDYTSDHYHYPEYNEELLPYIDNVDSIEKIGESYTNFEEDLTGSSSLVNVGDNTDTASSDLYGNYILDDPDNYKLSAQISLSGYICPNDSVFTRERTFQTQPKNAAIESNFINSWPRLKGMKQKISSQQKKKAPKSLSVIDMLNIEEMEEELNIASHTERTPSYNTTQVYTLCKPIASHETKSPAGYITPIDVYTDSTL